jgi:catalase (peroxidase I)
MGGNDSALKLLVEKIEKQLITDDEDWPIEYGSYIGFMMRLGWHCAGSYRGFDGRGGCDGARIRFNPELNWADNANLNHAIDWIKKHFKYYLGGDDAKNMIKPEEDDAKDNVPRRLAPKGPAEPLISFGDLIQLINVVAMNQAGLEPEGFCFGRIDNVDGAESNQLNNKSFPLAPEEPDLIYINAAGFDFDPITKEETKVVNLTKTVIDIRKTFGFKFICLAFFRANGL